MAVEHKRRRIAKDDEQLTRAWVAISMDPIREADQTKYDFWASVKGYAALRNKSFESTPTDGAVCQIKQNVSKYLNILKFVKAANESGSMEEDELEEALFFLKKQTKKFLNYLVV